MKQNIFERGESDAREVSQYNRIVSLAEVVAPLEGDKDRKEG